MKDIVSTFHVRYKIASELGIDLSTLVPFFLSAKLIQMDSEKKGGA